VRSPYGGVGSSPTHGIMLGKYDKDIEKLAREGSGGRVISQKLCLNLGYVSRRLKKLGLSQSNKNQYKPNSQLSIIQFDTSKARIEHAAESYLKYICDMVGFNYTIPPCYESYDLLVFIDGWKKVQVKSSNSQTFTLYRSRINSNESVKVLYNRDEVDLFFLFSSPSLCWLIPFDLLADRNTVRPLTIFPGFKIDINLN
jgi:hypothetical protein